MPCYLLDMANFFSSGATSHYSHTYNRDLNGSVVVDLRFTRMSKQLQRAYQEKHMLLGEIKYLKDKLSQAVQTEETPGIFKSLLVKNVQASTRACVWCIKYFTLKVTSKRFNQWKAVVLIYHQKRISLLSTPKRSNNELERSNNRYKFPEFEGAAMSTFTTTPLEKELQRTELLGYARRVMAMDSLRSESVDSPTITPLRPRFTTGTNLKFSNDFSQSTDYKSGPRPRNHREVIRGRAKFSDATNHNISSDDPHVIRKYSQSRRANYTESEGRFHAPKQISLNKSHNPAELMHESLSLTSACDECNGGQSKGGRVSRGGPRDTGYSSCDKRSMPKDPSSQRQSAAVKVSKLNGIKQVENNAKILIGNCEIYNSLELGKNAAQLELTNVVTRHINEHNCNLATPQLQRKIDNRNPSSIMKQWKVKQTTRCSFGSTTKRFC